MPSLLLLASTACDGGTGGSAGGGSGGAGGSAGSGGSTGGTGGVAGGGSGGSVGGAGGSAGGGSGGGGSAAFVVPTPFAVPLSAAGPDQLQSVTAASPAGSFLAAGFAAAAVGGPRAVTVVKFSSMGLDAGFGTMGVAVTPLVFVGVNDEIDITTQSDGKILVSATVANLLNPNDRDVAVVRLLPDGSVDAAFGTAGVAQVDLNDAYDNGMMLVGFDGARAITVDANDEIFVHAVSRGLGMASGGGPRVDTDFTVLKLSADGVVDASFGMGGQFRLDILETNANAKAIKALPDDWLLVGGYASTPDVGDTPQPVVCKLTAQGQLDPAFATMGVFHQQVLLLQTEVYGFAVHGGDVVTAGYGRDSGMTNDYVSLRFDIATGARDMTWGGAPNGAVVFDPSGAMLGSNARGAVALPDGGTLIHGSTGPSNVAAQDAVFAVLDANGELDTKYGTGIHLFKLGQDGNDQFWGGAVSGNFAALVGYKGGGAMQTDMMNDDAYGVIFPLQ